MHGWGLHEVRPEGLAEGPPNRPCHSNHLHTHDVPTVVQQTGMSSQVASAHVTGIHVYGEGQEAEAPMPHCSYGKWPVTAGGNKYHTAIWVHRYWSAAITHRDNRAPPRCPTQESAYRAGFDAQHGR